ELLRTYGSSPHTRGAQRQHGGESCGVRIIPAYAGSTAEEFAKGVRRADHPRIRGEHADLYGSGALEKGSSPHTRGALVGTTVANLATRIIPAYAGSTPDGPIQLGTERDHPRIRGEHPPASPRSTPSRGSSPHTRGAPQPRRLQRVGKRIIPAYAGSTLDDQG